MSKKAEEDLSLYVPGPVIFIRNYGTAPHDNYDCCQRSQFLREVIGRIPRPTAAEFGAAHGRGFGSGGNFPGPSRRSSHYPGQLYGATSSHKYYRY